MIESPRTDVVVWQSEIGMVWKVGELCPELKFLAGNEKILVGLLQERQSARLDPLGGAGETQAVPLRCDSADHPYDLLMGCGPFKKLRLSSQECAANVLGVFILHFSPEPFAPYLGN